MKRKPSPPSAGPRRAAIYRRVSSERQGERVSPEAQLSDCEAYARAHGYVVSAVYSDVERYKSRGRMVEPSGTRVDRPQFQKMLADGREGRFNTIIAWREDRLYRGVKPATAVDDLLEETGVTVELVKETFDRRMLFIKASIGRLELEGIRERTEMGMRARVKAGKPHGGPIPSGYITIPGADGTAAGYELDPAWRGIFDTIAHGYLRRLSLADIARQLGDDPRTGRPWLDAQISLIVRNPFYRGQVAYGWQSGNPDFTVPALHPAAWDADTCSAIERECARRGGNGRGPRGRALLSGILRCGYCGGPMAAMLNHGLRSYYCGRVIAVRTHRWHGKRTHAPNYVNERVILRALKAEMAKLTPARVDAFLARQTLGGPQPDDAQRRAQLESDQGKLRAKLADLTAGLESIRGNSVSATEAVLAAVTATGRQLDRVRAELEEMDASQRAAPDLATVRAAMLEIIANPTLFDTPDDRLQDILRAALPSLYTCGGRLVRAVPTWED